MAFPFGRIQGHTELESFGPFYRTLGHHNIFRILTGPQAEAKSHTGFNGHAACNATAGLMHVKNAAFSCQLVTAIEDSPQQSTADLTTSRIATTHAHLQIEG